MKDKLVVTVKLNGGTLTRRYQKDINDEWSDEVRESLMDMVESLENLDDLKI